MLEKVLSKVDQDVASEIVLKLNVNTNVQKYVDNFLEKGQVEEAAIAIIRHDLFSNYDLFPIIEKLAKNNSN